VETPQVKISAGKVWVFGFPLIRLHDDPATVAKQGFEALMAGKDHIIAGSLKTKLQGAVSTVLPDTINAEQHRHLSEPGSANK